MSDARDTSEDERWELASLRARIGPLQAELESHRVEAFRWRERARQLELEARPPAPSAPGLVRRVASRLRRPRRNASPPDGIVLDLDPMYYRQRYPDLAALSDSELIAHFATFGRDEGRIGRGPSVVAPWPDPIGAREYILIFTSSKPDTHSGVAASLASELSARYAVILITDDAGTVDAPEAAATVRLPSEIFNDDYEAGRWISEATPRHAPLFAILNGATTRRFCPALEGMDIPTVVLVQEFASDVSPRGDLANLVWTASRIAVPSRTVATSLHREHAFLKGRAIEVVGQPLLITAADSETRRVSRPTPIVVGAGPWNVESGIDRFLAVARRVGGRRAVRFVWVGPDDYEGDDYAELMRWEAASAPLADVVERIRDPGLFRSVLEDADVFLSSARAEPLSTAALEAGARGIAIVAFRESGTLSEMLARDPLTAELIVPAGDLEAAASAVERLLTSEAAAPPTRRVVMESADPAAFARRIEATLLESRTEMKQAAEDEAALADAGDFEPDFYRGGHSTESDGRALRDYLRMSRLSRPRDRPEAAGVFRRGRRGFHPLIWVEENGDGPRDPLRAWMEAGRPSGRWTHRVITNRPHDGDPFAGDVPRHLTAVHAHLYYPELIDDLLDRLARSSFEWKLIVTTDTVQKADLVKDRAAARGITDLTTLVVPNRGRDLGPLISAISDADLRGADLLLHVHGKKSTHAGGSAGDDWRQFLWGSLISADMDTPAIGDAVVRAFAENPTLGIVFPEDPHLHGWDDNRELAEILAPRLGVSLPLPRQFDFPQGTMFWARIDAIRPLLDLNLKWDEYPAEPVPVDGTILHTLERILPFIAEGRGFEFATTSVAGIVR